MRLVSDEWPQFLNILSSFSCSKTHISPHHLHVFFFYLSDALFKSMIINMLPFTFSYSASVLLEETAGGSDPVYSAQHPND